MKPLTRKELQEVNELIDLAIDAYIKSKGFEGGHLEECIADLGKPGNPIDTMRDALPDFDLESLVRQRWAVREQHAVDLANKLN